MTNIRTWLSCLRAFWSGEKEAYGHLFGRIQFEEIGNMDKSYINTFFSDKTIFQ